LDETASQLHSGPEHLPWPAPRYENTRLGSGLGENLAKVHRQRIEPLAPTVDVCLVFIERLDERGGPSSINIHSEMVDGAMIVIMSLHLCIRIHRSAKRSTAIQRRYQLSINRGAHIIPHTGLVTPQALRQ
jgi:hypothetical protein